MNYGAIQQNSLLLAPIGCVYFSGGRQWTLADSARETFLKSNIFSACKFENPEITAAMKTRI
jgi:hypothetical protein